ncbi:MAG: hypothetical protein LLG42_08420 [Chloroflexi bacterium]|nr:hypothetical protein [Chloroflexota bacterium]
MKPNNEFINLSINFWADVRVISQEIGYSKNNLAYAASVEQILKLYNEKGFQTDHIIQNDSLTGYGSTLLSYLHYRKEVLNSQVQNYLMDKDEAVKRFNELFERYNPKIPIPKNKQKKEKAGLAFFTGIINILIEANINGQPCDYDPHSLPVITRGNKPIQVLSRRVDGAFPSIYNPIAIWEIKEYYNTTTFGSRVADGVYETQVDGMELKLLFDKTGKKVFHYLFVDSHCTWWGMGISYLCRMIDILHMGYVDEVLFGKEVIERLPILIPKWLDNLPENSQNS